MDPVTISAATVALLSPYVKKTAEAFAEEAGKAIFTKTKELVTWVKSKLSPEGNSTLNRFEKDPDKYAPYLRDVLTEQMQSDETFLVELAKRTEEIKNAAPSVDVVIKMKEAEEVVGVKLREHKHGAVKANIDIEKGKKITGYEGDTM